MTSDIVMGGAIVVGTHTHSTVFTFVGRASGTDVVVVGEETTIDKCMSLMNMKKIRHLPVMDGTSMVGMITVGDLLKLTIKEQSLTIEELESFIREETGGSG